MSIIRQRPAILATLACAAAAAVPAFSHHAGAAVIATTWTAGTTGDWSNAGNWSPPQVPDNNSTDRFEVTIGGSGSVATLDSPFLPFLTRREINNLTVGAGATLNFQNHVELDLAGSGGGAGASIVNDGAINLLSGGISPTTIGLWGVDLTLSGGGALDMNSAANAVIANASSTSGLTFTNQSTILGSGAVGQGSVGIDNQGTINANDAGQTLSLAADSSGLTNSGALMASGGGILDIFGTAVANTGGSIDAKAGSTVKLRGGAGVSGGAVGTAGTGVIELSDATIGSGAAVTNNGLVQSNLGTINTIDTDIDNTGGSIVVRGNFGSISHGQGSTLNIANSTVTGGAVTVEGGMSQPYAGKLNLDSVQLNANSLTLGENAKVTLTDTTISNATPTIVASGGRVASIGGTNKIGGALTLPGSVSGLSVLNGSTLTLDGGAKTIDGFVEVKDGSVLNVDVDIAGTGAWYAGEGTINLNGVTVAGRGSSFGLGSTLGPTGGILNLDGATLDLGATSSGLYIGTPPSKVHGNGTIIGPTATGPYVAGVRNDGLMSPGFDSPGREAGLIEVRNRDYLQMSNGTLAIDLGGLTLSEFDRLIVTGGANAVFGTHIPDGGIIDVSLVGGFDPLVGSTFDILTAQDIIGFNLITFNFPTLSGGRFFDASVVSLSTVNGKAIRLSVLQAAPAGVPEPGTLALLAAGLALLGWTRRRRGEAA